MATLDVVVPAGVSAGETVAFADEHGNQLEAVVPDGLVEGDTFQVEVSESGETRPLPVQQLVSYMDERAASGDLMDKFAAWFEREMVGDVIDKFIERNAHLIGTASSDSEQSHEWWPLYQEYQKQFDTLLNEFMHEVGCDRDQFLSAAAGAGGMNDMYLKLFLAHSEYELFIEQMSHENLKQKANGS